MISSIKDKINTLASQRNELREKVNVLEGENEELKGRIADMQEELKSLAEKNKVLKVANTLNTSTHGSEANGETKGKINELVREIDKCIALLNK